MEILEDSSQKSDIHDNLDSFLVSDDGDLNDQFNDIVVPKSKLDKSFQEKTLNESKFSSNKNLEDWNKNINLKEDLLNSGYDSMEDESQDSEDNLNLDSDLQLNNDTIMTEENELVDNIPSIPKVDELQSLLEETLETKELDQENLNEFAEEIYSEQKIQSLFNEMIRDIKNNKISIDFDNELLERMGLQCEIIDPTQETTLESKEKKVIDDDSIEDIHSIINDGLTNATSILDLFGGNSFEYFESKEFLNEINNNLGEIVDLDKSKKTIFPIEDFVKIIDEDNEFVANEWYKMASDGKYGDDTNVIQNDKQMNDKQMDVDYEEIFKEKYSEEELAKQDMDFIPEKIQKILFDPEPNINNEEDILERLKKISSLSNYQTDHEEPQFNNNDKTIDWPYLEFLETQEDIEEKLASLEKTRFSVQDLKSL